MFYFYYSIFVNRYEFNVHSIPPSLVWQCTKSYSTLVPTRHGCESEWLKRQMSEFSNLFWIRTFSPSFSTFFLPPISSFYFLSLPLACTPYLCSEFCAHCFHCIPDTLNLIGSKRLIFFLSIHLDAFSTQLHTLAIAQRLCGRIFDCSIDSYRVNVLHL